MIFVMLGTQPYQFNRLIEEIIEVYENPKYNLLEKKIIIQSGYTKVNYKHFETYNYLSYENMTNFIRQSDYVVTHGGAGSIFSSLNFKKKVIAFPRLKKYNEHIDDHQTELVKKLSSEKYILGEAKLKHSFDKLSKFVPEDFNSKKKNYISYLRKIL